MVPGTKAYLRDRYRRIVVDDPQYVRGKKGRYTLGTGSFARAELAEDTLTGRQVVIKCQRHLPPAISESIIHAYAAAASDRVIALLDVAAGGREHYMVLEKGEPLDLQDMTEARALDLMQQLVAVLQASRACDVFHGDIAPRNLYLVQGRLKVSDFNFAAIAPGPLLRPVYVCLEAAQFCDTCVLLLKSAGSKRAAAFAAWCAGLESLDMAHVSACPWFTGRPDADLGPLTKRLLPGVHATRTMLAKLATGILPLRLGPPEPHGRKAPAANV